MKYDVFIDESGLFTETSTDPSDRIIEHKRPKKFASQLAGIVVREGALSPDDAWKLFQPACNKANVSVIDEFHSIDVKQLGEGVFDRLVIATCRRLDRSQVQPFRFVNRERVSFGNRKANYVNMVGELLVRICRELDCCDKKIIVLNVYQAGIKNSEYESGNQPFWEHEDFVPTLKSVFQRASIAAGWARESSKWRLGTFKFRSGAKDRRLWLCDLISNASHNDFTTVSKEAAESLRASLKNFDLELSFNVTLVKINELCGRNAFGMAIVELLEAIFSPWATNEAKAAYVDHFDGALLQLLELPPLARTPQIQTVLGWLQQTADDRNRLSEAKLICKWFDDCLLSKHESSVQRRDSTLFSWVRLGIATASLTACNHSGDLALGRLNLQLIDNLIPNIAGRWEYVSDLMHSIVVQAVHLIDGFEHEVACDKLRLVVGYYQGLGELFDSAYPGLFPELVRSKFCGDALGTMVQAQIGLILQGKTAVDEARLTSKMAVEQFSDEADRKRQFQCRSEIDCIAGEWDAARKNLMLAIGAARADHDSLSKCIAELDAESRAFPLLHWTRIGGMAAIADAKDELVSFLAAWNVSGLDSYIQKELSTYPSHGILRRVAGVYAACGRYTKMVESIRTLRQVVLVNPTPLLRLIETASVLQAAGLAGRTDPQQMMNLICGTRHDEPIEKSLQKIISETVVNQPRIAEIAKHFLRVVNEDLSSEQLIYAAQIVGY